LLGVGFQHTALRSGFQPAETSHLEQKARALGTGSESV
jgi:hypothetical protein